MRLFLYIILALLPLHVMAKSTLATANADNEQQLLKLLDSYIDKRNTYSEIKEEKIKKLKLRLRTADNNSSRLSLLNTISTNTILTAMILRWYTPIADLHLHKA